MKKSQLQRKPMVRKVSTSLSKGTKRPLGGVKKRKTTTPLAKLKKELWELCKQIIRKQYGNTCYTCEAPNLAGANWHTGHFIPSSVCGAFLRYDLRNLRPQCYRCNINLAGNGSFFYRALVRLEGQGYVDILFSDKLRITKLTPAFLQEKVNEYKALLEKE